MILKQKSKQGRVLPALMFFIEAARRRASAFSTLRTERGKEGTDIIFFIADLQALLVNENRTL